MMARSHKHDRRAQDAMVNFHCATGIQLVPNEEEVYKYWLRTVSACLKAEEAYGPHVVYRLCYTTLVENLESALRSLLDFVGRAVFCQMSRAAFTADQ